MRSRSARLTASIFRIASTEWYTIHTCDCEGEGLCGGWGRGEVRLICKGEYPWRKGFRQQQEGRGGYISKASKRSFKWFCIIRPALAHVADYGCCYTGWCAAICEETTRMFWITYSMVSWAVWCYYCSDEQAFPSSLCGCVAPWMKIVWCMGNQEIVTFVDKTGEGRLGGCRWIMSENRIEPNGCMQRERDGNEVKMNDWEERKLEKRFNLNVST